MCHTHCLDCTLKHAHLCLLPYPGFNIDHCSKTLGGETGHNEMCGCTPTTQVVTEYFPTGNKVRSSLQDCKFENVGEMLGSLPEEALQLSATNNLVQEVLEISF